MYIYIYISHTHTHIYSHVKFAKAVWKPGQVLWMKNRLRRNGLMLRMNMSFLGALSSHAAVRSQWGSGMEERGAVRRVFSSDCGNILFRNLPSSDVEAAGGVSRNVEETWAGTTDGKEGFMQQLPIKAFMPIPGTKSPCVTLSGRSTVPFLYLWPDYDVIHQPHCCWSEGTVCFAACHHRRPKLSLLHFFHILASPGVVCTF